MSDRDDELDALKIRQIAMLRRATYRARSYAIIAAVVCAVATVQIIAVLIRDVRLTGWGIGSVFYSILAVLAPWGSLFFARRAIALHREMQKVAPRQPTVEPDFSTLSDGSQQVRNLENIQ